MEVDPELAAVLDDVRAVDWHAWAIRLPGRLYAYEPGTVVAAFEALAHARGVGQSRYAYGEYLTAVAHNHSGTPYAVLTVATPLLARLVPVLGDAAAVGMEALTDCALWSVGEPPFVGPDGEQHDLGSDTLEALKTLAALAHEWSTTEPADGERWRAAKELLKVLDKLV